MTKIEPRHDDAGTFLFPEPTSEPQMKTDYLINAVVVAAACAIPGGLALWYVYPDSYWWLLSVGAFIFFYAG